ncbi:MAG: hypothetical protein ACR5K2_01820 [Wolbachia sp.]
MYIDNSRKWIERSVSFDSEYNHVASIFTDLASQFNDPAEALQNLRKDMERNISRQSWVAFAGEKVELFVDKI